MMGNEFLKEVKGTGRTFVIRSKNGPLAAAAAMGMMTARSQTVGPYFLVSDLFIHDVDIVAPNEKNIESDLNEIDVDFKRDWMNYLRTSALPALGLDYKDSCTLHGNTIRYLNSQRRSIPDKKTRTIHESRELLIPPKFRQDYEKLVNVIQDGGDLTPYLSRQILKQRSDERDGLLNAWGIHHLHFQPDGNNNEILFCVITESDVYMIFKNYKITFL